MSDETMISILAGLRFHGQHGAADFVEQQAALIKALQQIVQERTEALDRHFGTPCEQIRHQHQIEERDARIAALEAERDEARKDAKAYADAAKQQREWKEEAEARIAALEEHVAKQQMDIVELGIMAGRRLAAETRIKALEEGLREIAEQCPYGHAGAVWAMDRARALLGGKDE